MADKIIDFFTGTVYGGIISILIGAYIMFDIYNDKKAASDYSVFFPKWKGFLGGLGLVGVGILTIIMKVFYPELE